MTLTVTERNRMITGWLVQAAADARQAGCGRWELGLRNGGRIPASASVEDDWFVLRLPLEDAYAETDEWSLLRRNGSLEGLCKIVLDPARRVRQLRADIPLDTGHGFASLSRRIVETLRGFESALKGPQESFGKPEPIGTHPSLEMNEQPIVPVDVAGLLEESGWTHAERSPLKYAVDLDVRGGFTQAMVAEQGTGAVAAYVECARYEGLSDRQREALGRFLLTACGIVRMARASIVEAEAAAVAGFEVRIAAPGTSEICHALAALSTAADFFGRESRSLADGKIAEIYLMAGGSETVREITNQNNNQQERN